MDKINTSSTALVVIDLQKGIASMQRQLGPYTANEVIAMASQLAQACRKQNIPVFLVHVQPSPQTALHQLADTPMVMQNLPASWAEFVPQIGPEPSDLVITKQQWGAFYGTDLDLQLRRRKIQTIILCGIATNIGVESTARFAYEYGYEQIFAEDAMTAMNSADHATSINAIFKRIGRVKTTKEIVAGISKTPTQE